MRFASIPGSRRVQFAVHFALLAGLTHAFQPSPFGQARMDESGTPSYFEDIDRLATRAKLKPLRAMALGPRDVEVRIWQGWGNAGYRCRIIRRTGDSWSGVSFVEPPYRRLAFAAVPRTTNWAKTWDELEGRGLANLQGNLEIPRCKVVFDGGGYAVEVARPGYYRSYFLEDPRSYRSEDGDRFLHLLPTIYRAFGERFNADLAGLEAGEMRTVSSVSVAVASDVAARHPSEWKAAGEVVPWTKPAEMIGSEKALAQSIDLRTPVCDQIPGGRWNQYPSADVTVEVVIDPAGAVFAARAISGPPQLAQASIDAALKWRFAPDGGRTAKLTIQYRTKWVAYPWLTR